VSVSTGQSWGRQKIGENDRQTNARNPRYRRRIACVDRIKQQVALVLAALFVAACSETGPIAPTPEPLEAWVKIPETADPRSDRLPVLADPVVNFHLAQGQRRSALRTDRDFGLGQTYLLGFDIRLDRKFTPARPVAVSRFMRQGKPETELVSVQLDARHGVTVMGRSCIKADELGKWHRVEFRIRLADDDAGFLEVFCDRRPIWARSGFRTTLPPTCRRREGCNRGVARPVRFEWQLGLMSETRLRRETRIQMQRLFYHRLFIIPHRVENL